MGASLTSINFQTSVRDPELQVLQNSDFTNSLNFSGGIFLDIRESRNFGKWSINNELLYTSFDFQDSYTPSTSPFPIETELAYSYLKLNTMVRYRFLSQKVIVFMNAGISNGFALSETNSRKGGGFGDDRAVKETRKYEQSLLAGIGALAKKFSIEFRIEKGNGMSNMTNLSSASTRLYFLLGYKL